MAIGLSVLAAIIAGSVGLTLLSIALIILGLRHKHRRLLSQINSASERGLSDLRTNSNAIMSITDEDVARMPGTQALAQRSQHTPYSCNSLYTPMASRESRAQRLYTSRARANDLDDHVLETSPQSWPLPRRMTRADGTPLVKLPSCTLTPGTKRSSNAFPPPPKDTRSANGSLQKKVVLSNDSLDLTEKDGNATKASSATNLTPKPLFHGKQRSTSHGVIIESTGGSKTEPRVSKQISQFPRSKSMYSQEPGLAPSQTLPSLSLDITSKRLPRVKSPEPNVSRVSGGSIFSEQTCILDEKWSQALPQPGTKSTSITLPIAASAPRGLGNHEGNHTVWESSHEEGRASPLGATKPMAFQPQLNSQRSFRASIQESLPRSQSSGLSLSMSLHGPSRAESRDSLARNPSSPHSKLRVAVPRSAEKRILGRGISPSSPLRRAAEFTLHNNTNSTRASKSVLRPVSGNEGNPWDKRPRSITTSSPPKWDIESTPAGKISTPKDRGSGNERHNTIRISQMQAIAPSPAKPSATKEQEELPLEDSQSHSQNHEKRQKIPRFRPPSREEFDFAPQTTLALRREHSQRTNNSHFSPTQFMMNLYREDDNDPDSEVDTPTRKPKSRRSPSLHPNRRKTIFDSPTPTVWPVPALPNMNHPDPEKSRNMANTKPCPLSTHPMDQNSNPSSRPTSSIFNFPWPHPPTTNTPTSTRHRPKTLIRHIQGSRDPPFRYISPQRRHSPLRSNNNSSSGVGKRSGSPVKDLRRSVAALRRMNSEVVSSGGGGKSRGHRRYLSIGEKEGGGIFADEAGGEDDDSRQESRGLFSQTNGGADGREEEDDDDGRRVDGRDIVAGPTRDTSGFGGMKRLGYSSSRTGRFEKSPSESMYDGNVF